MSFAAAKPAVIIGLRLRHLHWIAGDEQGVFRARTARQRTNRSCRQYTSGGVWRRNLRCKSLIRKAPSAAAPSSVAVDTHGLKKAGSLSALNLVLTMSAASWCSRSSRSSHILRKLARIGAFREGARSIRVRAMQKAMPSVPILVCSTLGLLMAGSLTGYRLMSVLLAPLLDQIAGCG